MEEDITQTDADQPQETRVVDCDELKELVAKITAEKAELEDKYIRKHADFENYRKRMTKEKAEAIQYANADLMKELLGVLDNLDRAREASNKDNTDIASVRSGVELITQTLVSVLNNRGLKRMETVGKEFDPQLHQAIANTQDEAMSVPTVTEEFQAGYTLFDRVLRPAMVRVAMPQNTQNAVTTCDKEQVDEEQMGETS